MRRVSYIVQVLVVLIIVNCPLSIFNSSAQTLVYLEQAETLLFDEDTHAGAQLLIGNVRFRHEDAFMYCDSAYFYEKENSLDAFGNVRFVQGDTLFGYSDQLNYDGNTKFARMRRNVRLIDKATVLITDSLNYDRAKDIAWYWTGGQISDSLNVLTSLWGQYESKLSQALFKTDVHLVNDRFVMDADTLKYNTNNHIADILGPTTILYEKETTITTTLGWYNTDNEKSMLLNRSFIAHIDGQTMTGDTIFYDKKQGFGQAFQRMELTDSAQNITLYGNYGEMYEKKKVTPLEQDSAGTSSIGSHGFATDSALMVDWSDSTTFTYMHADTLFTEEIFYTDSIYPDSVPAHLRDSVTPELRDSSFRLIRGFYGMRLFRDDMQAVADSAVYNTRDSILALFGKPILWSDNQQISAKHIDVFFKDSTMDYAHGVGDCIAIQQQTPRYYNQMAGKEMFAYVRDGEVRQVDVSGNAETVFFPQDEQSGDWLGINKTQSSFVKLFIKDEKIDHVVFTSATTGTMYPIDQLSDKETHLAQFFWADYLRPRKPGDVFDSPEKLAAVSEEENTEENKENLNTPGENLLMIDKKEGIPGPPADAGKLKKRN